MRTACLVLALLLGDYLPEVADAFHTQGIGGLQRGSGFGRRVLKPTTTTPVFSSNDDEAFYGEGSGPSSPPSGARRGPPGGAKVRGLLQQL